MNHTQPTIVHVPFMTKYVLFPGVRIEKLNKYPPWPLIWTPPVGQGFFMRVAVDAKRPVVLYVVLRDIFSTSRARQ